MIIPMDDSDLKQKKSGSSTLIKSAVFKDKREKNLFRSQIKPRSNPFSDKSPSFQSKENKDSINRSILRTPPDVLMVQNKIKKDSQDKQQTDEMDFNRFRLIGKVIMLDEKNAELSNKNDTKENFLLKNQIYDYREKENPQNSMSIVDNRIDNRTINLSLDTLGLSKEDDKSKSINRDLKLKLEQIHERCEIKHINHSKSPRNSSFANLLQSPKMQKKNSLHENLKSLMIPITKNEVRLNSKNDLKQNFSIVSDNLSRSEVSKHSKSKVQQPPSENFEFSLMAKIKNILKEKAQIKCQKPSKTKEDLLTPTKNQNLKFLKRKSPSFQKKLKITPNLRFMNPKETAKKEINPKSKPNILKSEIQSKLKYKLSYVQTNEIIEYKQDTSKIRMEGPKKSTTKPEVLNSEKFDKKEKRQSFQFDLIKKRFKGENEDKSDLLKTDKKKKPSKPHILKLKNSVQNENPVLPRVQKSNVIRMKTGVIKFIGYNSHKGIMRDTNEDEISVQVIDNVMADKRVNKFHDNIQQFALCSIFDGHGGSDCSQFLKENLHELLLENSFSNKTDMVKKIKLAFSKAGIFFKRYCLEQNTSNSGSCVLSLLTTNTSMFTINLGDSRCVLSSKNGNKVGNLTNDHKPEAKIEFERIVKNGGSVFRTIYNFKSDKFYNEIVTQFNDIRKFEEMSKDLTFIDAGPWRIEPGNLSVSRTIGDFESKNVFLKNASEAIMSEPEINEFSIDDADFAVLGCYLNR